MSNNRFYLCSKETLIFSDERFYFECECPFCEYKTTVCVSDLMEYGDDDNSLFCDGCDETYYSIGIANFFKGENEHGSPNLPE